MQLWILVYSSLNQGAGFPLCLGASEKLLKGSYEIENTYEAFT